MHQALEAYADRLYGEREAFDEERLRALARGIDPKLAEKAVFALEYVAQLAHLELPFVFTGGTAAQILLDARVGRLSKDVDIMTDRGGEADWERAVAAIAARFDGRVYQATRQERTHGGLAIKAVHFGILYPTAFPSAVSPDIELDVVFAPIGFATQQTPLRTGYYRAREPLEVRTPTIDALLGGKLTTFGPGTIGIPRDKRGVDLSMAQQLYDVDRLIAHVSDWGAVAAAYRANYDLQITYHPPDERPSLEESLADGLYVLQVMAATPGAKLPSQPWGADYAKLGGAARTMGGYVGAGRFERRDLRIAASCAAAALALVRLILLRGASPEDAARRWTAHLALPRDAAHAQLAMDRISQRVPGEQRPYMNLKEFALALGPEALLTGDLAFSTWT